MLRKKAKKAKKKPSESTRARVRKEMAKPRMARSGRIAALNLDTSRIREQPSTTMPGTVDKIIPSPRPSQPEKAQITVDRNDQRHRDLRIENTSYMSSQSTFAILQSHLTIIDSRII